MTLPLSARWSPTNQATFCATLVDEWVRAGLTDAVVCPGSRSTPMAVAFANDDRLAVHVHHDERSGAFLALGLAATTGRPVAIVATSGTATVNFHPAVVEADLAGVPLIVCTANRPFELQEVAAPQTIDQERLYGRSTRWYVRPGVPDGSVAHTWRSTASRVWTEAMGAGAWPGPVQIDLEFREPLLGEVASLPPGRPAGPWHPVVAAERVRPVLDADLAALPGVIVAGRGTIRPDDILALADDLGWPVFADPLSGCRGVGAVTGFDPLLRTPFADRARPDVVLHVGAPPASKVLGQWLAGLDATEIVVAPSGLWPDPGHRVAATLDTLPIAPAGLVAVSEWREAWSTADALVQAAIDERLADTPMSEPAVARHLTRTCPPGGMLVVSSSMPIRDVEWFGVGRRDLRVHANRGANGIDGVVSTAVGAALAGVRTTLLIGDVAFLHDSNGLLGLAGRGVDLTIVVVDNDGGGIFSFLPQASSLPGTQFEQLFGTPHGVDFEALARAHGITAEVVTDTAQLGWKPGVRVLLVATDRRENVEVHQRLHEAVVAAITAG